MPGAPFQFPVGGYITHRTSGGVTGMIRMHVLCANTGIRYYHIEWHVGRSQPSYGLETAAHLERNYVPAPT